MSKDVIRISEDDSIAQVVSKIKDSKEKIIALVLPENPEVFQSVMNIKLILKTSNEKEKVPVLITEDEAVLKIATKEKIYVAKNLKTRPEIAKQDNEKKQSDSSEEFLQDSDSVMKILDEKNDNNDTNDDEEKANKKKVKNDQKKKWFKNPKIIIPVAITAVTVICFFVWAFVFSQSVTINVKLKTTGSNFSEQIRFTKNENEENVSEGIFYIRENKLEDESSVEYSATDKKDIGEKAKGNVTIKVKFTDAEGGYLSIPANTTLESNGNEYRTEKDARIQWSSAESDDSYTKCENNVKGPSSFVVQGGCEISTTVKIQAIEPGEKYNIDKDQKDWKVSDIKTDGKLTKTFTNSDSISGGTSKVVSVVGQSAIDEARKQLSDIDEETGKNKLFSSISDSEIIIQSTYKSEISEPEESVKAGEQIGENETAKITSRAIYVVYSVDAARIEEYLKNKIQLGENQKIYSMDEAYIEYYNESGSEITGKLKTKYNYGAYIDAITVVDRTSGKKIGEAQNILKSIIDNGNVTITPSYFWVNKVPQNINKITVNVEIEE